MSSIITNSEEETMKLAKKIAKNLKKGDVVVLSGDLGAGKTLFTSGILDYYGKKEEVSSPTFTIVNEYELEKGEKLFHFDVYRLNSPEEFLAIGGEEFFDQGICLIEWGEKILEVLPQEFLMITIEKDLNDVSKRKFSFSTHSSRFDKLMKEAFEE